MSGRRAVTAAILELSGNRRERLVSSASCVFCFSSLLQILRFLAIRAWLSHV